MKLYLAGPMTGYPRWNFDAFAEATAQLRAAGYEVVSPAEEDLKRGFDPDAPVEDFSLEDLREAMRRDVAHLFEVDAVALLPGWLNSRGALAESYLADALHLVNAEIDHFLGYAYYYNRKADS